jgi:hypothetical protein
VLAFLSSCGTITSRNRLLSLDTSPRGLEVRDQQGELLGRTPLVLVKPARKDPLFIGQDNIKFGQKCHYDWKHSLIPNAAITAVNPLIGLSFYGVDFFKDRLKTCLNFYHLDAPGAGQPGYNRKMLILPSLLLEREHMGQLEAGLEKKFGAEVIPYQEGLKKFSHFRLHEQEDFTATKVPDEVFLKLAQKLKMTDLVLVRSVEDGKLHYEVIDFYDRGRVEYGTLPMDVAPKRRPTRQQGLARFIRKNVLLLPNSAALSSDNANTTRFKTNNGEMSVEHRNRAGVLGQLFQSVAFDSLQHPLLHDEYSFSFQTAPSLLSLDTDSRLNNEAGLEISRSQISIYALSYNAFLFLHTPLGAFSIGAGLGQSHWVESHSSLGRRSQNTMFAKSEVAWTAFLTDRWFIRLVLENYSFNRQFQINPAGTKDNIIGVSSFRFGYYLPELSGLFF